MRTDHWLSRGQAGQADSLSSDDDAMMSKSEVRDLGLLSSSDGEGGSFSSEDERSGAGHWCWPQQQQLRFDSLKPPLNTKYTTHRCLRACRAVCCVRRWARHRQVVVDDDDGGDGDETNRVWWRQPLLLLVCTAG